MSEPFSGVCMRECLKRKRDYKKTYLAGGEGA